MKKAMKQSTLVYGLNLGSLALLLITGILFAVMMQMNARVEQANDDRFQLNASANQFISASDYLCNEVRAYAATGHTIHYDNYINEAEVLDNTTRGVENMKAVGITAAEEAIVNNMLAVSDRLIPLETAAMEDVQKGDNQAALQFVYGEEYSQALAEISSLQSSFLAMLDERTQLEIDQAAGINRIFQIITFAFILFVGALQIFNLITVRKKVLRPIAAIESQMQEIASGHLGGDFTLEADTSEIGMLIDSIHRTRRTLRTYIGDISEKLTEMSRGNLAVAADMDYIGDFAPIRTALETILRSLNDTLGLIHAAAGQVSTGADQVASGAQALSAGSTQQAASVEQLTASADEISKQAEENNERIAQANKIVHKAGEEVANGNTHMEQLTQSMEDIGRASAQIGNITKVIEDIAFQTNILALNAAIEAARAGSAGKGFAVVADEVRSLAAKSAEAAQQTEHLITESVQTVAQGSTISQETAHILQEVGAITREITETFDQIQQVTGAQASAIEQILQGLSQVSSVVQTNAATAEENSATSEEMSAQAATLNEEVQKFRLSKTRSYLVTDAPAYGQAPDLEQLPLPGNLVLEGAGNLGKY